ncbi:MAG TPA: ATP-binding cassette domain-containing protein [Syntrophales bacterium]|nr:ATP-binding cassette domain-containing protein [Syntrophales bacterium]HOX94480.1 ATP-binding cassette domain-containing protein [Syntrophales bacterium]HPN25621.1 ATP-binding cassette domain-containing protein [Syntrophales bacterium]HQM28121.1 ATP-binding cassette domain-containing protein [Syntrophales bacterium]
MQDEVILQVENLHKSFGGVKATVDVSFQLRRGEFIGIIGPNGSGKTTLINLITGFVKPDAGRVLFKGRAITGKMPYTIAGLGVARTFQMVHMFYNLPAFKNIIIPLCSPRVKTLKGGRYGERDDIAIEILDEYGFERDSFIPYRMVGSLPHGYLKRLDLARAMSLRPEVLLLDELFSGMSMSEVAATLPMLEKLSAQGLSMIMVEHRLRELFRVVSRVIVLNFGAKIAEGLPEEVMKDASVMAAYLGSESQYDCLEMVPSHGAPPPEEQPETRPEAEKILEVKKLTVFFENALAANDISLEVAEGEIVGILGSNSAGKTTLMNAVSGLILDQKKKEDRRGGERIEVRGEIIFRGENITYLKPSDRVKKGMVLCRERHPIFRDSTVLENLRIAGKLRKRLEVKESIAVVFEIFPHLLTLKKRKAGLLSGGEQQMLAIGMALVTRPSLLLLDEPLLGLSPLLQSEVTKALKTISGRGVTILVTEQFARPLIPIIDRGYVIENGIIVMGGTGRELADNPDVRASYLGV